MSEIDDLINMIDGKMNSGVSRLKVGFSEESKKVRRRKLTTLADAMSEVPGLPELWEIAMLLIRIYR